MKKKKQKTPMQRVRKPIAPPTRVIPDKKEKKLKELEWQLYDAAFGYWIDLETKLKEK